MGRTKTRRMRKKNREQGSGKVARRKRRIKKEEGKKW